MRASDSTRWVTSSNIMTAPELTVWLPMHSIWRRSEAGKYPAPCGP
ncbi:hypothetical protein VXQ18_15535 [Brucella abortus]|nr:hypothetical protein [Brucella abortus]